MFNSNRFVEGALIEGDKPVPDPERHAGVAFVKEFGDSEWTPLTSHNREPPGNGLEVCTFDWSGKLISEFPISKFAKDILSDSRYRQLSKKAYKKHPSGWCGQLVPIEEIGDRLKQFAGDDAFALQQLESKFSEKDFKAKVKRDKMKVATVRRNEAKSRLAKTQEAIRKLKAFEDEQTKILAKLDKDVALLNNEEE